jgi:universal stress protein E
MRRPHIMVIMTEALQHSPALLRGLSLARRMGAVLQLCSFEYRRGLDRAVDRGFDLDAYLAGRKTRLEAFAAGLRRDGVEVDARVIWGRPIAERILLEVLALRPDLVVKDVPHYRDPSREQLNGLDWHLLSQCPAPLMLVQPRSPSMPMRILAAVDPMDERGKPHELNHGILRAARSLAEQCHAELDVMTAFEYLPVAGEAEYFGLMPDLTLYGELRKIQAEGLYDLCKDHGVPPSQMHVVDGPAAERIANFATDRHVDLVVMGSIYRKGLKRLFLGSTAEGVFDTLPCDVLLMKPEGFAEELQASMENGKAKAA